MKKDLCKSRKYAILISNMEKSEDSFAMLIRSKENTFTVRFSDGEESVFLKGISLLEILEFVRPPEVETIVLAKVNNRIRNLRECIDNDCSIEWIPLQSAEGYQSYVQTLSFIFLRAMRELYPKQKICIKHKTANGLYWVFCDGKRMTRRLVKKIRNQMDEIIQKDESIQPEILLRNQAIVFFQEHSERPFWSLESKDQSRITVYQSGNYENYPVYPLFHSSGYLKTFEVRRSGYGILLRFPESHETQRIPPLVRQKKLLRVYEEQDRNKKILNIREAEDVNDAIADDRSSDLISIAEGQHERKIRDIAENLIYNRKRYRTVLIAGPSASGKATVARRLEIALRVNGIESVVLHLDDYLLDSEDASTEESSAAGSVFTSVVDTSHLNHDVKRLLKGDEVEIPYYNPVERKRIIGPRCKLKSHQPILIEGCYDLFNRVAQGIPRRKKYYIYVDGLTQLNVMSHLKIDTRDVSLLRLLLRNLYFYNIPAATTIEQWNSVNYNEKWRIFPLLEKSDVLINSSLVYELGVLRVKAVPVLETVSQNHPGFPEARRLLQILSYFSPIRPHNVPSHSVLREFIGDSRFDAVSHPGDLSEV